MVYTTGGAVVVALAVGLTLAAFGWLEALRATEETRRRAYAAEISAAFQALDENNLERAIDLLGRQRPKPGEEDLRGFEWRHLWQLCRSDVKDTLSDANVHHPTFSPDNRSAFSPDGRRLFSTDFGQEAVKLWDVSTGQELLTLAGTDSDLYYAPRWSADGNVILAGPPWQAWSAPSLEDIAAAEAMDKMDNNQP